nr:hypothetical protein PJ912_17735 [Pectobacterium colocasium]
MSDARLNLITLLVFCSVLMLLLAVNAWRKSRQQRMQREQRWQQILNEVSPSAAAVASDSNPA